MNNKLSIKTHNLKTNSSTANNSIANSSEKPLVGYAQIIQGKLWTHYKGQTLVSDVNKGNSKRRSREGKVALNQISAPMPGKITKITVALNQEMEPGQAIIVMEAMKMEYTLKCDSKAQIEKILVSVGDQVPLGHVLVTFKTASNN